MFHVSLGVQTCTQFSEKKRSIFRSLVVDSGISQPPIWLLA